MMKGGGVKVGDQVQFELNYDPRPPKATLTMPEALAKRLKKEKLVSVFDSLIPSRKKEIFRYLHELKTEASRERNIEKIIMGLKDQQRP